MRYLLVTMAFMFSILTVGCGSSKGYKQPLKRAHSVNAIIGSWYKYGLRYTRNNLQIKETKKEQFFQNGQLLSSKWFSIQDRIGRDLGEFYITKLFRWNMQGNRVVAQFQRCNVGIVRALKAPNIGYNRLKRACQNSLKRRGKITVKRIQFLDRKRIKLGNELYFKE